MSIILASSDWHCGPDGLPPAVNDFFHTSAHLHLGVGDCLDFTAHNWRDFLGSRTVKELDYWGRREAFFLIPGNHDPRPLLERVIAKTLITAGDMFEIEEVTYTHGDQWGGWWKLLKPFAAWYPGFYRWLQRLRPTPGKYNPFNLIKHNRLSLAVQAQALLYAMNTKKSVCIGHTHLPAEYQAYGKVMMVDCGQVKRYLWGMSVNGDIRLRNFR